MAETHHVIPQQRIKQARSSLAIRVKQGDLLTAAEAKLLRTPLWTILNDSRNTVRLSRTRHHRAHNGFERLTHKQLPRGIEDFAEEYALTWALDHELRLIEASS